MHDLHPGAVLSYSAGSNNLEFEKYRLVDGGSNRFTQVLACFPELLPKLGTLPPIVLSCYPATLGSFTNAIFVDSYMRPSVFAKTLLLATHSGRTAVVLGQPLAMADLFAKCFRKGFSFPRQVIAFCGGYPMPQSLARWLHLRLAEERTEFELLCGYGIAEVDFGVLVGRHLNQQPIRYVKVADSVELQVSSNAFSLRRVDSEIWHTTGDRVERIDNGYYIQADPARFDPLVLKFLDSWTDADWDRRTGYLYANQDRNTCQLREDLVSEHQGEMEFFQFARKHGASLLDKPNWAVHREA